MTRRAVRQGENKQKETNMVLDLVQDVIAEQNRDALAGQLLDGDGELAIDPHELSELLVDTTIVDGAVAYDASDPSAAATVTAVLDGIRDRGPLSTGAFREHGHAVDWWWAATPAARAVMEALFVSGRLGIARREGNRRFYDLIERLVPAVLLERRESEEDAMRHRLLSRYRAVGLLGTIGNADVVYGTGSAADRARRTAEMVAAGLLIPVGVESLRDMRYILTDELALLDDGPSTEPAVSFLAPLDPLVWDRRLLRQLFGFDYIWEVYVPAARRRHG
jgi:uncharacterized protein